MAQARIELAIEEKLLFGLYIRRLLVSLCGHAFDRLPGCPGHDGSPAPPRALRTQIEPKFAEGGFLPTLPFGGPDPITTTHRD